MLTILSSVAHPTPPQERSYSSNSQWCSVGQENILQGNCEVSPHAIRDSSIFRFGNYIRILSSFTTAACSSVAIAPCLIHTRLFGKAGTLPNRISFSRPRRQYSPLCPMSSETHSSIDDLIAASFKAEGMTFTL